MNDREKFLALFCSYGSLIKMEGRPARHAAPLDALAEARDVSIPEGADVEQMAWDFANWQFGEGARPYWYPLVQVHTVTTLTDLTVTVAPTTVTVDPVTYRL